MDKLKLRVKASDYELEAEGSRDFLNEQYEAFKQLLEDVAQKQVVSKSREKDDFPSSRAIAGVLPCPSTRQIFQEDPRSNLFRNCWFGMTGPNGLRVRLSRMALRE